MSTCRPEALAALRDGRYMRASLILREYLAAQPDTSAAAILLTAQADAGWGDWAHVRQLLQGRNWLDVVQAGYGWSLLGRSQLELGDWRASGESYARFLTVTHEAGSRARGLAQLQRARALAEQRRFADAVQAFDTAAALLPRIADWIQVFAASAAAGAADTAAVRRRLAGAMRRWPAIGRGAPKCAPAAQPVTALVPLPPCNGPSTACAVMSGERRRGRCSASCVWNAATCAVRAPHSSAQ
jgi:tetratricopeptide (TPR) repeat protein